MRVDSSGTVVAATIQLIDPSAVTKLRGTAAVSLAGRS